MALPSSGSISSDQILAELRVANPGRNYPLSLNDADVLNLAGKSGSPISYSDLYGKSSFTVTGNSSSGNFSTVNSAGTATCNPSVTVVGGAAPIAYSWSFVGNPNNCTLSGASNVSCTVGKSYAKQSDGSANATLQCVVTDSAGNSRTVAASANLDWYSNR